MNISDLVVKADTKEDYRAAVKIIRGELKKEPDDHWLMACLSTCYHGQGKYKEAVGWAKKSLSCQPNCCLALWYYASAVEKFDIIEAEKTYRKMLRLGVRYFAYREPCGEGIRWTKGVLNDVRFRLSIIYRDDKKEARKWMKLHLRFREPGVYSIYSKKLAQKILTDLG